MTRFVAFIIALLHLFTLQAQKLKRIEPANWWTQMAYNDLQILCYGTSIGHLTVTTDYPGVSISSLTQVPNPNYLFVGLHISDSARPGTVTLVFEEGGKTLFTKDFPLLARAKGSPMRQGFTSADAIYLITPDRFANGQPANDNVEGYSDLADRRAEYGRHGGDIEGIRQQLPYIAGLGMTAVWICPMLENAMPEASYHGYAITDFYAIDPRMGSNQEYKQMVEEAHKNGLKVIKDVVLNHCGKHHWWMNDLPAPTWLNQWPEYTPTNHTKTIFLDPHGAGIDKRRLSNGWFVPSMPDLNQRHPLMAAYLIQNTLWWIEYAGLDGLRIDTYSYSDPDFLTHYTKVIMEEYPNFNIVGEEWSMHPSVIAYWQQGNQNPNGYVSHLPSVMDFPLQSAVVNALNGTLNWASPWDKVYQSVAQDHNYPNPHNLLIFADNHDMSRIFTQLEEDFEKWKLAITLVATMRGIPQVYYGTEVLLANPNSNSHGEIRADMPGGWPGDTINAFTGRGLTGQQLAAKAFITKLYQWRQSAPVMHDGKLLHYAPSRQDVYVFFRYDDNNRVMIALNRQDKPVTLSLDHYTQGINGATSGYNVLTGRTVALEDSITIPARSPMILELAP